ncbi:MAG: MCE family protein [Deltaproteobacteria bacterium]|nr:MCE family protein [Deltaproteobacteria bacterium]
MKGLSLEVRVGLLVLTALLLLGGFVFMLGGIDLGEGYTVFVDFDNPGNIKPGAPVNVGSVRIGRVQEIEYRGGRMDPATGRSALIRVEVRLDADYGATIHDDAMFYVTSQSLLGEQNLAVDPGNPERPRLAPGSVVTGVDPPRLDLALALAYELLETFSELMRQHRDEIGQFLESAARVVAALDHALAENPDALGNMLEDLEQATHEANLLLHSTRGTLEGPEVRRSLRNLDRSLGALARNVDPLLADARSITHKLDESLDAFGPEERESLSSALRRASSIAERADSTLGDAQAITTHIREGHGTVGALLMDEEIYDDIQEMLRDLKHNPWKLFWRE